ncbi:alpha-amylase family protein [Maribacter sp. MAR_2009_72]|uniref:alpha-amylase family protein n=1 Tax=Maribacter sp. MAR_2009_72 TaxID=1250050 RepID=UPI00119A7DBA|nr:alpha-amylase family protein [Maribacter sp. MAR_2009_72]TVZ15924.1 amylosucrase [Maribacter sp. MAR_2009_72]
MNQAELHRYLVSKEPKIDDAQQLKTYFDLRLATNLSLIKSLFFSLYNEKEYVDQFYVLIDQIETLYGQRSLALQQQDIERLRAGNWYQSEQMVGMQLYVDRFNKNISGLNEKLPYFKDLGINFLHLMPVTNRPAGENDGGYAVNSYHEIDPRYGTKDEFVALTKNARKKGIFLMLDFVVNHTSDEFEWAKKAKAGNAKYQGYYYTYPTRHIPDEFEKTLPEIFPQSAPGNFTYNKEMEKWVMTCFNHYQWDLNYRNPEVFIEMLANLMSLANLGVDVIRFDALAFLWKKLGTQSQNLPEAHALISLFRMCLQVIAPGVILLAEAIVAPRNILKYFGEGMLEGNECEIAYNASLMALLWNSIATKQASLMLKSLTEIPTKPKDATWINYIRCHDDIGLGYDDNFIASMGWDPRAHKEFLLNYYCGKLAWSPAKGLMFMYNPKNGDGRITGSAASLLGLETALAQNNKNIIEYAIAKILMMHGIILTIGGIPMIYAGDEIGTLNDYTFEQDADHVNDNRWVNRPLQDWNTISKLNKTPDSPPTIIFKGLKNMIRIRKDHTVFKDTNNLKIYGCPNPHIFVYKRTEGERNIYILSNFNEVTEKLDIGWLHSIGIQTGKTTIDLLTDHPLELINNELPLKPFQQLWIKNS